MDETESYEERRERIRALPYWVAPALDMNNWGNRHFKPTEDTGVRYRFHISKNCRRLERWRASWGWQPLRGWTVEADGALRHYTGITEDTLDVCEYMVNDWVRVSNTLFADCEYPEDTLDVEECEEPAAWTVVPPARSGFTTRRAALDAEAAAVVELVLRKGAAYGDSYKARTGQLRDTLFENAIRINDKASRLYTLTRAASLGRTIDHGDEAVRDTLRDLAGYALLLLAECAGEAEEATA